MLFVYKVISILLTIQLKVLKLKKATSDKTILCLSGQRRLLLSPQALPCKCCLPAPPWNASLFSNIKHNNQKNIDLGENCLCYDCTKTKAI